MLSEHNKPLQTLAVQTLTPWFQPFIPNTPILQSSSPDQVSDGPLRYAISLQSATIFAQKRNNVVESAHLPSSKPLLVWRRQGKCVIKIWKEWRGENGCYVPGPLTVLMEKLCESVFIWESLSYIFIEFKSVNVSKIGQI